MFDFADPLQEFSILLIASTIITRAIITLKNRFKIVKYEQASVILQVLDKQGYLTIDIISQFLQSQESFLLVSREKMNCIMEYLLYAGGMLQGTPEDIFKILGHHLLR